MNVHNEYFRRRIVEKDSRIFLAMSSINLRKLAFWVRLKSSESVLLCTPRQWKQQPPRAVIIRRGASELNENALGG